MHVPPHALGCCWSSLSYSGPSLIRPPYRAICQENVATLEMWPLVKGRSKHINSSSGKDLWPY